MKNKHQVETIPRNNYETPVPLLKQILKDFKLNSENFTDICATKQNRKFKRYITKKENALNQNIKTDFFCNPPFDELATWVTFCHKLHQKNNRNGLMLIPCYTDSNWWTKHIGNQFQYVDDFKFLDKRLGFWYHNRPVEEYYKKISIKPNKYWMPCVWILWRAKN
jgi:hypothetical protein